MNDSRTFKYERNAGVCPEEEGKENSAAFPVVGFWMFGMFSWAGFLFLLTLFFARFLVPH